MLQQISFYSPFLGHCTVTLETCDGKEWCYSAFQVYLYTATRILSAAMSRALTIVEFWVHLTVKSTLQLRNKLRSVVELLPKKL